MSGSFVDCADLLSAFHMRGGGEAGRARADGRCECDPLTPWPPRGSWIWFRARIAGAFLEARTIVPHAVREVLDRPIRRVRA